MPLFLVAVAAALPGRALEFAALGEERASRVGESATGVDGIPPAEATPCKKKGDWKCKFKAMRIERNALRAESLQVGVESLHVEDLSECVREVMRMVPRNKSPCQCFSRAHSNYHCGDERDDVDPTMWEEWGITGPPTTTN